jgi:hypothetical protein
MTLKEFLIRTGFEERAPQPEAETTESIAKARFDLVIRFVAVAISVGFATTLSRMEWIQKGAVPNEIEMQEILRLATALFVSSSGWEWYHRDIAGRVSLRTISKRRVYPPPSGMNSRLAGSRMPRSVATSILSSRNLEDPLIFSVRLRIPRLHLREEE